jgi:fibrillarin-like rRNA methylase
MWKDPIVEETRKLREQYASQFNHDIDAIFKDIQQRQAQLGKKLVSFPARKPFKRSDVA